MKRNNTIRAEGVNREFRMVQQRFVAMIAAFFVAAAALAVVLLGLRLGGHGVLPNLAPKAGQSTSSPPSIAGAAQPRVASVTPAGSDILIGIGAADHLVGVSNYDDPREGTAGKPRIGDYQNIDWEKLSALQPQILIVFYAADRIPPALQQRCDEMGIRIMNVKIETLENLYAETNRLAEAVGEAAKGKAAVESLKAELVKVAERVAGQPRVKTILVTGDNGLGLAGPGTFLDELLTIAGGENALKGNGPLYREVDREMLRALAADVVIQLIPDGEKTPQVLTQARQFWDSLGEIPAVRNHRVHVLSDWYSLQPGFRVGMLAGKFAEILHPDTGGAASASATSRDDSSNVPVTNVATSSPGTRP